MNSRLATTDERVLRIISNLGEAHRVDIQRELGLEVCGCAANQAARAVQTRLDRLKKRCLVQKNEGEFWRLRDGVTVCECCGGRGYLKAKGSN